MSEKRTVDRSEKRLSDKALREAKPGEREYLLKDGGSLYARVRRAADGSASISWMYTFKWNGRAERLSIGTYPRISLAQARRRRDSARELLAQSPPLHPVLEAKRVRAEAFATASAEKNERTVKMLFADWKSAYLSHHRKDGGEEAEAYFEHDVFPYIGNLSARSITNVHVAAILDRMVARGARRKANSMLALLKQFFNWAVVRGAVAAHPAFAFTRKDAGGEEARRTRALTVAELESLAQKLPAAGLSEWQQAAVRLILATGVRVGELNRARWQDVDEPGRLWRIPPENSKNGREHLIHLSWFALEALQALARSRVNDYLLPSRKENEPIDSKAIAKLLRDRQREKPLPGRSRTHVGALRLDGGDWSPHDLRRTFSTRLAALGVAPHVKERCLNHTQPEVEGAYDLHDYAPERREALEKWGAQLARIFAAGVAADVAAHVPVLKAPRRRRGVKS